ncbi:MAG: hypothetical protein Q8927_21030 [Bacteroidota bacterium]|nr:hypothetical protein [Bacteroidota bacterium]MDP4218689.1 hypothetical protein [Bacteroidota bacterium]MDP4247840.1 hypothetical protein [Bacteroidota bacterium]MDP4256098.1 hypothetical protein [Bacteroidota bacterium]MDP4260777.1 hypothetical protein [Bacteroidota bacterium]
MRKYMLFFSLLAWLGLAVPACKKAAGPQSAQSELAGTWVLYALDGGIAGEIIYPPGDGVAYHFYKTGSFEVVSSGTRAGGTYTLSPASPVNEDKILLLTWSLNSSVTRDSVRISGDKLSFLPTESCCDAAYYVYRRINYFF